jgi:PhnB protein
MSASGPAIPANYRWVAPYLCGEGARGPKSVGGTPCMIAVYVEDVDDNFDRAEEAGATALRPVEDQFFGDRSGQFEDPFGHRWSIATHIQDVSPDEMARRAAEMYGD